MNKDNRLSFLKFLNKDNTKSHIVDNFLEKNGYRTFQQKYNLLDTFQQEGYLTFTESYPIFILSRKHAKQKADNKIVHGQSFSAKISHKGISYVNDHKASVRNIIITIVAILSLIIATLSLYVNYRKNQNDKSLPSLFKQQHISFAYPLHKQ